MRDANGFLLSGSDLKVDGKMPKNWNQPREPYLLETSVPGIFVAGDVRHGSVKRVASAVGEGSISVQFIHQVPGGASKPMTDVQQSSKVEQVEAASLLTQLQKVPVFAGISLQELRCLDSVELIHADAGC